MPTLSLLSQNNDDPRVHFYQKYQQFLKKEVQKYVQKLIKWILLMILATFRQHFSHCETSGISEVAEASQMSEMA